ncbi:MAG: prephenate dehydrogenase/arogenate dehydrogenase family protein, partial [Methylococcaceae bacterium]|nr:prephenate dehydrogenase/arogenate dehydrogenase family protein [Methylococcaceae bacterium]
MRTGIVGLGAMGVGMARNLAKAGQLVAVYNRTPSKAEQLGNELNVKACQSLAELAQQTDLIITCVSADQDVIDVINGLLPGLSDGNIVVDTSTVSSNTAIQIASLLSQHAIGFLDAPVSGGQAGAENGQLTVMIGGENKDFE